MANKFSILILGLLLIVPHLSAAPAPKSSEESMEILSKPLMERFKLLVMTLEEFASLFVELSSSGPEVFKAVLADPKVNEDTSEENQKYLKELKEYVEKSEKVKKESENDETFDMLDGFTDIINKFDSDKHPDLSPAALAIGKSLKEHGLAEIEDKIQNRFESFIKKFVAELEEYSKGLSDKEKGEEKDLIELFNKLKSEKDIEKQIEMFDNFIDTDSDETD